MTTSDRLTHLIYASVATRTFGADELEAMLHGVRLNNARLSVTGMLLHTAGSFFQILEGAETAVADLFARVAADPRHTQVTRIIHEPIAGRAFGEWTMGYQRVDAVELARIDGLNDFFEQGVSLARLGPGRAKKLLTAFAGGRWHSAARNS